MKFLIDTYAWIDYLEGGKLGEKVRKEIFGNNEIFSLMVTIAEVISKVKRKGLNVDIAYNAMVRNSKIIEVNPEISKNAGLFHADVRKKIKNFGLVDALLLMTARDIGAKIITGDLHFHGYKEAVFD